MKLIIVPGGANFADTVRYFYDKYLLSEDIAHKMAILAMDQYGLLLKDIAGEAILTYSPDDAIKDGKGLHILLPSKIMFTLDPLENTWDVTSDSIAAYIASYINAEKLILVKNVDGLLAEDINKNLKTKIIKRISAEKLLKEKNRNCVDGFLPKILIDAQLFCYIVNGKHPERIESVLNSRTDIYTEITPKPSKVLYYHA